MSDNSIFFVNRQEVTRFRYDIPFISLIPFTEEDYARGFFKTTIRKSKQRFNSYGITLEKIEKKIAEILEIDYEILKKYRETGEDGLENHTDSESVENSLTYLYEEVEPDLHDLYMILQELETSNPNDDVELDIREMKYYIGDSYQKKHVSRLFDEAKKEYHKSLMKVNVLEDFKGYDFFICHDSTDKKSFVEPLAKALKKRKINVWYDRFVLEVGDSLIEKIDEGLKKSRFGIVVLSKNFIRNSTWPRTEFNSLKTRELHLGQKLILPIWRKGISKSDVAEYNLELADRFALSERDRLESIVAQLEVKLRS